MPTLSKYDAMPIEYKLLLFSSSFTKLSAGFIAPIFAIYALKLGGDLRHIGELTAVYTAAGAIMGIFITKSNNKMRLWLLFFAYIMSCILSILYLIISSHLELYFLQAGFGLVAAVRLPAMNDHFNKHTPDEQRTYYQQIYTVYGAIAGTISALMGGYFSHHLGFRSVFLLMIAASIVSLCCLVIYLKRNKQNNPEDSLNFLSL